MSGDGWGASATSEELVAASWRSEAHTEAKVGGDAPVKAKKSFGTSRFQAAGRAVIQEKRLVEAQTASERMVAAMQHAVQLAKIRKRAAISSEISRINAKGTIDTTLDSIPSGNVGTATLTRTMTGGMDEIQRKKKMYDRQLKDLEFMDWKRRVFGIGKKRGHLPESRLVHPLSPFAKAMTAASSVLLLYTALVTPVVIGFFWFQDSCKRLATLEIDMAVDTFFLLEIAYTFCLGTYTAGHAYVHDYWRVAAIYLKFQFWFDMITSIPVSYVEYFALVQCSQGGSTIDPSSLRVIRFIKPFRLIRMLRLIRTQNLFAVFDYIEQALHLPPFLLKTARLLGMIFATVHIAACMYWLIKEATTPPEHVAAFLIEHGIEGEAGGLMHKYILANYFINTVFTTVGFGEIHPLNSSERLYVTFVMYMGTFVFGAMLAEVNTAVAHLRRYAREKAEALQKIVDYLREKHTDIAMVRRVMEWADYDMSAQLSHRNRDSVMQAVPEALRDDLSKIFHGGKLNHNPVFLFMQSVHKEQLQLDLWQAMAPQTFEKGMLMASGDMEADRMFVIVSGTVRMEDTEGNIVNILRADDFFGTYSLFGHPDYGLDKSVLGASFYAVQMVTCMVLTKDDFDDVLDTYTDSVREGLMDEMAGIVEDVLNNDQEDGDAKVNPIQLGRWLGFAVKLLVRDKQRFKGSASASFTRATQVGLATPVHAAKAKKKKKRPSQENTASGEESMSSMLSADQGAPQLAPTSAKPGGSVATTPYVSDQAVRGILRDHAALVQDRVSGMDKRLGTLSADVAALTSQVGTMSQGVESQLQTLHASVEALASLLQAQASAQPHSTEGRTLASHALSNSTNPPVSGLSGTAGAASAPPQRPYAAEHASDPAVYSPHQYHQPYPPASYAPPRPESLANHHPLHLSSEAPSYPSHAASPTEPPRHHYPAPSPSSALQYAQPPPQYGGGMPPGGRHQPQAPHHHASPLRSSSSARSTAASTAASILGFSDPPPAPTTPLTMQQLTQPGGGVHQGWDGGGGVGPGGREGGRGEAPQQARAVHNPHQSSPTPPPPPPSNIPVRFQSRQRISPTDMRSS